MKTLREHAIRYCVNTYDYGLQYVYATSKTTALSKVGYRIFGRHCWDYGDLDHWDVTEIPNAAR